MSSAPLTPPKGGVTASNTGDTTKTQKTTHATRGAERTAGRANLLASHTWSRSTLYTTVVSAFRFSVQTVPCLNPVTPRMDLTRAQSVTKRHPTTKRMWYLYRAQSEHTTSNGTFTQDVHHTLTQKNETKKMTKPTQHVVAAATAATVHTPKERNCNNDDQSRRRRRHRHQPSCRSPNKTLRA